MVIRYGVDCSDRSPGVAALRAARCAFVCRYEADDYGPGQPNPKCLTSSEATMLRNGGIMIVSVWETTANRALDGYAAGRGDARTALNHLHKKGAPANVVVFFAVDFDAAGYQSRILPYFQGAASILGINRTGVYGGYAICAHLYARGFRRIWQTYAWSGGRWAKGSNLRQYSNGHAIAGVGVDLNQALVDDFGQWSWVPAHMKPAPKHAAPAVRIIAAQQPGIDAAQKAWVRYTFIPHHYANVGAAWAKLSASPASMLALVRRYAPGVK